MLTLYGRITSSNVQAVLWLLEELELDYERLDYGFNFGGLDTPDYLSMNPHGKVPVLKVGETAIFESAAIVRYLASIYGDETLWPRDPLKRAQIDMWAVWAKNSVAGGFTGPIFWLVARTRPERQDPDQIDKNVAKLQVELTKADAQLQKHDFLCGPDFTIADIQLGHVLYRYYDVDIQRADLPALRAYYERLTTREAYQKSVMVSYEILRNSF